MRPALALPAALGRPIRRFLGAERGVAAIEFAVILPILLVLLLTGTQVVIYINASRKVGQVARSISQMVSQSKPPSDNSTTTATVNALDLHFSFDAAMVIFPYLLNDAKRQNLSWWGDISINYASIAFTKVTATCNDRPTRAPATRPTWSGRAPARPSLRGELPALLHAAAARRQHGGAEPHRPAALGLRPGHAHRDRRGVQLHADAGLQVFPAIKIARSAYVQPRYASLINYDTTNSDGIATNVQAIDQREPARRPGCRAPACPRGQHQHHLRV